MTLTSYCFFFCLVLLLLVSYNCYEVDGARFSRFRSSPYSESKTVEEITETPSIVPDQSSVNSNRHHKDFGYENLELNLVRPNKESHLHAQISTKYTTSILSDHTPANSLENAETAEEYVSKAVQRYGSRFKQPIRIESETEPDNVNQGNSNEAAINYFQKTSSTTQPSNIQQDSISQQAQQPDEEEDRSELDVQVQSQRQLQQQEQLHQKQQQQKQHQVQMEYFQTKPEGDGNLVMQQNRETLLGQPAPVHEKELERSTVQSYDDESSFIGSHHIDRNYRTKYAYEPSYKNSQSDVNSNNDKVRVSASTEIPKAEIMKQIEKSVIRYMQELEAEGKIITAPKEHKAYYKLVTVPVEHKRVSTTTTSRPKYRSSESSSLFEGSQASTTSSVPLTDEKTTRYQAPTSVYKHHDYSDNIASYQPAKHTQHDAMAPNIEFVYKIKSRTPLQTATVKTLSKPYALPQKGTSEQFDHTAVLKSMEEFDLRHVIAAKDIEDHSPSGGDNFRLSASEYRKMKDQLSPSDYKGYPGYFAEPAAIQGEQEIQSENLNFEDGYPIMNPSQYKVRKEHPSSHVDEMLSNPIWDQPRIHGKPLLLVNSAEKPQDYENYSFLKYNNHPDSYKHLQTHKPERDRESFHIVHKHVQRHALGHRGKRGGTHHSSSNKMISHRNTQKDTVASFALRPPPKQ